jgi:hypothetical protein
LGSDVSCQIKTVCAAGIIVTDHHAPTALFTCWILVWASETPKVVSSPQFYDSARIIAYRAVHIKSGNISCCVMVSLLFENVSQHPGKVIGASSGSIGDLLAATGSHRHNRRVGRQRTDSREERALADLL